MFLFRGRISSQAGNNAKTIEKENVCPENKDGAAVASTVTVIATDTTTTSMISSKPYESPVLKPKPPLLKDASENRKKVSEVYDKYFSQDKHSQKENDGKRKCLDELKDRSKEVDVTIMSLSDITALENISALSCESKSQMETIVESIKKQVTDMKKTNKIPAKNAKENSNTLLKATIEEFKQSAKKRKRTEQISEKAETEEEDKENDETVNNEDDAIIEQIEKQECEKYCKKIAEKRKIYKATLRTAKKMQTVPN